MKIYYIEIEISLLTKSGPHYSPLNRAIFRSANRRDWEKKRRTMIIFAKIYRIYFSKYYHHSSFPNRGDVQVHMKRKKTQSTFYIVLKQHK
jgi:hypothetical protein